MRICLAIILNSPTLAPILHLAHVEALLLLPRNQGIRRRFNVLYRNYSLAHLSHSDPYSEDADAADSHPEVIAARRPIIAIEVMLTNGRYQVALDSYREAFLRGDRKAIRRIEQSVAAIIDAGNRAA